MRKLVRDGGESERHGFAWTLILGAVVMVAGGSYLAGATGALIGNAITLLAGFDIIRREDRHINSLVRQARRELKGRQASLENMRRMRSVFSKAEEATGQPDPAVTCRPT